MEQIKSNVSFRLNSSDKKKMKDISGRLGVKESELFRYAINSMLNALVPFGDEKLSGSDLIPAWLECGPDLLNYFHIDAERLNKIFHPMQSTKTESTQGKSTKGNRVDMQDLDLMILSSLNENFVVRSLSDICKKNIDPKDVGKVLQNYLYEKYVIGDEYDEVDAINGILPATEVAAKKNLGAARLAAAN